MPDTFRVAVIGHTGHGNYGHGVDTVWEKIPNCKVVAVADADANGLAAAAKKLKAPEAFADYREMLDKIKPDIVGIGPRWLDQHRDLVVAAAERGNPGIYLIANDQPLALHEWLPAFARWLSAPPPPQVSVEDALKSDGGADAVYYGTQMRGVSNAKAKRDLNFQPRPLEWVEK